MKKQIQKSGLGKRETTMLKAMSVPKRGNCQLLRVEYNIIYALIIDYLLIQISSPWAQEENLFISQSSDFASGSNVGFYVSNHESSSNWESITEIIGIFAITEIARDQGIPMSPYLGEGPTTKYYQREAQTWADLSATMNCCIYDFLDLTEIVEKHIFVGIVDINCCLSLIQYSTNLYLANHDALAWVFSLSRKTDHGMTIFQRRTFLPTWIATIWGF